MYYPYTTFPDGLHVAYSERHADGTIYVMFEWPMYMDMGTARCTLPSCTWDQLHGIKKEELTQYNTYIARNRALIESLATDVDGAQSQNSPVWEAAYA